MEKRKITLAITVMLVMFGTIPAANAGVMSSVESAAGNALNSLLSLFGDSTTLAVGKVLNTGQVQQLQSESTLDNQTLQETNLHNDQLATAKSVNNYNYATNSANQLNGQTCQQSAMAIAQNQAVNAASAQGQSLASGAVGDDYPGGAVMGPNSGQQTSLSKIQAVAATTSSELNADSIYHSDKSAGAMEYLKLLVNPIDVQQLTPAQAATPAGKQYIAFFNQNAAKLSVAAQALGKIGGFHAVALPASAVEAVAAATGATASTVSAATPAVAASSTPAPTPPAVNGNGAVQKAATPTGRWTQGVPKYAGLIASIAKQYNLPPQWFAAIIHNEDGTENLQAMPCGTVANASPYLDLEGAYNSYRCADGSTAKSLGQITDPTWPAFGGAVSPMVATESATAELEAMATGAKQILSAGKCDGNIGCSFALWNQGEYSHYYPGFDAGYVNEALSVYTGKTTISPTTYNGASSSGSSGSGNSTGNAASEMGLLRLIGYSTYANPTFYSDLYKMGKPGALRTAVFLNSQDALLANQKRKLLAELAMVQAADVALSLQGDTAKLNHVKGQAMQQYNQESFVSKAWQWLTNTL